MSVYPAILNDGSYDSEELLKDLRKIKSEHVSYKEFLEALHNKYPRLRWRLDDHGPSYYYTYEEVIKPFLYDKREKDVQRLLDIEWFKNTFILVKYRGYEVREQV